MPTARPLRARLGFAVAAFLTIALGLTVHRRGTALPPALRDVLGDALWAMMIAWLVGALAPRVRLTARAAIALAICWLVEAGQLLHAPALVAWRGTTLGRLVLGSDFDARDLLAYALGVGVAVVVERAVRGQRRATGPAAA